MSARGRLALLLLAPALAMAGPLRQAYQEALRHDAAFASARADAASAEQLLPLARAGLRPAMSATLSDAQVQGTRSVDGALAAAAGRDLDYRSRSQSLNLRLPLYDKAMALRVEQAQAQTAQANALLELRRIELVDRLASALLQQVFAGQGLALAEKQQAAAMVQLEQAQRKAARGEAPAVEVLDAQAAAAMSQVDVAEARGQLELTRLSLRQMTGQPPDGVTPPALAAALPLRPPVWRPPALADLLADADAGNPALAARRHMLDAARAGLARSKAGHQPRLDLVGSVSSLRNDTLGTLNQSANLRSLGLQLNVPLFSGGAVDAAVDQARAEQDKAEADLQSERHAVARDLAKLSLQATVGAAKVQALGLALDAARAEFEGAGIARRHGLNTRADLAQAERKLAQAQQDLLQSVIECRLAQLRILARTGTSAERLVAWLDDEWGAGP